MNSRIFPLAILILTISGIISQSFAVSFFLLLSLALGGIMVFALFPVNINRKDLFDVYYISFCVFVLLSYFSVAVVLLAASAASISTALAAVFLALAR